MHFIKSYTAMHAPLSNQHTYEKARRKTLLFKGNSCVHEGNQHDSNVNTVKSVKNSNDDRKQAKHHLDIRVATLSIRGAIF